MKKNTLLNKLIDEIDLIDKYAFSTGKANSLVMKNKFDKSLALHRTRAFKIIDLLRNL